jgi:hypothetical protein
MGRFDEVKFTCEKADDHTTKGSKTRILSKCFELFIRKKFDVILKMKPL